LHAIQGLEDGKLEKLIPGRFKVAFVAPECTAAVPLGQVLHQLELVTPFAKHALVSCIVKLVVGCSLISISYLLICVAPRNEGAVGAAADDFLLQQQHQSHCRRLQMA
jgi:hypothetical protein